MATVLIRYEDIPPTRQRLDAMSMADLRAEADRLDRLSETCWKHGEQDAAEFYADICDEYLLEVRAREEASRAMPAVQQSLPLLMRFAVVSPFAASLLGEALCSLPSVEG